jgi:hypothetical protein
LRASSGTDAADVSGDLAEVPGSPMRQEAAAVAASVTRRGWQTDSNEVTGASESCGAIGGQAIRGRGHSLGAPSAVAATGSTDANLGGDPQIRGLLAEPGARAAAATEGEARRIRAQRRVDARNAHLRWSLEAHEERVANKRSYASSRGEAPTAADRIEAIRRRIAARANARGAPRHECSAAAVPEAGDSATARSPSRRNELRHQIHLLHAVSGIHDDPACEGGVEDVAQRGRDGHPAAGMGDACTGAGWPGTSSDTANAASRVAWHDVSLVTRRPG